MTQCALQKTQGRKGHYHTTCTNIAVDCHSKIKLTSYTSIASSCRDVTTDTDQCTLIMSRTFIYAKRAQAELYKPPRSLSQMLCKLVMIAFWHHACTHGSAKSSGKAVSWILEGLLKPISYRPRQSSFGLKCYIHGKENNQMYAKKCSLGIYYKSCKFKRLSFGCLTMAFNG